jgi:hypothetical protein
MFLARFSHWNQTEYLTKLRLRLIQVNKVTKPDLNNNTRKNTYEANKDEHSPDRKYIARSTVEFAGKKDLSEYLMKQPASTARPSELGGHPSMFPTATLRHCAQPVSPTVSTHCAAAYTPPLAAAAASPGTRGTAAAKSATSARAASAKPPAWTAEPLQSCVLPGSVDWSKKAALSYRSMQPSRMARPPLAARPATQVARSPAAAASKQATQSRPATYGRHCAIANAGAAARGSAAVAKPTLLAAERLARRLANVELRAAMKADAGVALYWLHPWLSSVACGSAKVIGTHADATTKVRAGKSRKRPMRWCIANAGEHTG